MLLDPLSIEVETQRGSVGGEMSVKVVLEHPGELIRINNVGTGGDKVTARQSLVKGWVVSSVQLIDDHLPDGVSSGGTLASVTVTLVRHPVVESVGPLRYSGQRSSDGGIVDKELVSHHLKLLVATNSEEGSSDSSNGAVSDVGESLDDQPGPGHLSQPVIVASLGPVVGVILVSHGEDSNLVTPPVQLLDCGIVGVSVRNIECSLDGATIRVDRLSAEDLLVQVNVVRVDGAIEGDGDHLRNLVSIYISRNPGSIRRAETVRKLTHTGVAVSCSVRILR